MSSELIEVKFQVVIKGFLMKEHAEALAEFLQKSSLPTSVKVEVQEIKGKK